MDKDCCIVSGIFLVAGKLGCRYMSAHEIVKEFRRRLILLNSLTRGGENSGKSSKTVPDEWHEVPLEICLRRVDPFRKKHLPQAAFLGRGALTPLDHPTAFGYGCVEKVERFMLTPPKGREG